MNSKYHYSRDAIRTVPVLFLVSLLILLSVLALPVTPLNSDSPETPSPETASTVSTVPGSRSIVFEWYSFFEIPMIQDVWKARAPEFSVVSYTYPQAYLWDDPPGNPWYYAPARMKATGRNLPEINIDKLGGTGGAGFLPLYLTNTTGIAVPEGGTANISWYMQYIDKARATALKVPGGWYDGWITELVGTVAMDKNATIKVLGITESEYNSLIADIGEWWSTNKEAVETAWESWLDYEGNTRLDIYPLYEYIFEIISTGQLPGLELTPSYDPATETLTFTVDLVTWGMEALLARWFQESFMPGYEYWYSDLSLDMTIGPTAADVDLDLAQELALYMWSAESVAYGDGVWAWEAVLGDIPYVAGPLGYTESPSYPYFNKTYYNVGPDHPLYNDYLEFDYTPASWNLQENEALIFNFSNTIDREVWALTQMPDGTLREDWGHMELGYNVYPGSQGYAVFEPFPEHLADKYSYDTINKVVNITGPFNMTLWSKTTLEDEWYNLEDPDNPDGLLPWGCPYIEFAVVIRQPLEGDINGDGFVNIFDLLIVRDAMGSTPGDPNWNPDADIATGPPVTPGADGIVNIFDLLLVSYHLGETA